MLVLVIYLAVVGICLGQEFIGFGAQRLKNHESGKKLRGASSSCPEVEGPLYFTGAVVDNFASEEKQTTWSQRYWLNRRHWAGKGAPIFVFIGGEGEEAACRLSNRMYMYELAQEHHAMLVDVEHRFYGDSMPVASLSTDSLSLLTSEQGLADLARIIQKVKSDLESPTSQVITVGGSYPGNLAAWFRLKYPSITSGSIASSAPLRAQTEFPEYMDVVTTSIEYFSGQGCVDAFAAAAEKVSSLISSQDGSGLKQLERDFKTCGPIQSKLDVAVLLSDLMGNIQGTVQYNNEHAGVMNVTDICSVMTATTDAYNQFVELTAKYRQANGQQCEDASFADSMAYLGNATFAYPANAARSWTYQTCNEFGYFQTATSRNQPFFAWRDILNLDFSLKICNSAFDGWSKEPQVAWMNSVYGGERISATNVVFTSGTIDPWHALGVTNFTAPLPQKTETPVYITGTAHCNDLYAPNSETDPESLVWARQQVAAKVAQFLLRA